MIEKEIVMSKLFVVLFTFFVGFTGIRSYAEQSILQDKPSSSTELVELIEKLSCDQVQNLIEQTAKTIGTEGTENIVAQHQRRLFETYAIIRRCGLNSVTDEKMLDGQLSGMVGALNDPHSDFLNNTKLKEMDEDFNRHFIGIGIETLPIMNEGKFIGVKVVAPIPGSPAALAGVLPDDQITEIEEDGESSHHISSFKNIREVMKKIRGVMGSSVTLTFERKGVSHPIVMRLKRTAVAESMISGEVLPSGWVWMHITQFTGEKFCEDLLQKERMLQDKAGSSFRGTILDLQNNPGGTVEDALCTVSLYARDIDKDKSIILLEDRDGIHDFGPMGYIKNPGNILQGKPLVILVNPGSASASEIVAKAFQYYGIGEVVGTPTYGKGSVQQVIPLSDGMVAVKLTIAQYLIGPASDPVAVQKIGVMPNILMNNPKDASMQFSYERDLVGSIPTSTAVKEKPVIPTQKSNPLLFNEIIDVLTQKPFLFTLQK